MYLVSNRNLYTQSTNVATIIDNFFYILVIYCKYICSNWNNMKIKRFSKTGLSYSSLSYAL